MKELFTSYSIIGREGKTTFSVLVLPESRSILHKILLFRTSSVVTSGGGMLKLNRGMGIFAH